MKAFITFLLVAVTLVILAKNSYPQTVNPDSVKVGKFYSILLVDGNWIDGEVLDIDSLFMKLRNSDGGIYKLAKKQVEMITLPSSESTAEYYAEKYGTKLKDSGAIMKPELSLSGGMGFFTSKSIGNNNLSSSFVLDFEGIYYFGRHTGVRLSFSSNFFGNDDNSNYYDPYYYYYEEGENLSVYVFTLDLLAGSLKPEEKTKHYFTCGFGAFIMSESGESYGFPGVKLGYGISRSFSTRVSAGAELLYGGAIPYIFIGLVSVKPKVSYKLSKNFNLFLEPQYTFPVGFGYWGGFFIDHGYFTVKSGITLGSF